jgi:putative chitinase
MLTKEILDELKIDQKWLEPLNNTLDKYEINTNNRIASFIGQCQQESGNFRWLEENLNYSTDSLMRTWSSRFPTKEIADQYARNPEKIANKVYGGRMGNTEDGDGWFFRGRGIKQLTGRENYQRCGSGLGIDLLSKPDLLLEPKYACLSAGWFWNKHNLNELADKQDYTTMTKRINGGLIGHEDRVKKIANCLQVLNNQASMQ